MPSREGTAFNNRACPYVSHTGTVREFATHTGPELTVMTGYGHFAHGAQLFVKFYIRFCCFWFVLFWQRNLATCIFCMVQFMLLDENSSIPVQVHTEISKNT